MTPREHDFGRGADADVAGAEQGAEAEAEAVTEIRVYRGGDFYSGAVDSDALEGKTKAELLALAEQRGVEASGTKADIIAALSGE